MNTKIIEQLVERYLAGETSHEEEAKLVRLIESGGVQSEYLFILEMLKSTPVTPIVTAEEKGIIASATRKPTMRPLYWIGSAAAVMLLLIGISGVFKDTAQPVLTQEISKTSTTVKPDYKEETPKKEKKHVPLSADIKPDNETTPKAKSTRVTIDDNMPTTTVTEQETAVTDKRATEVPKHEEYLSTKNITINPQVQNPTSGEHNSMPTLKGNHRLLALSVSGGTLGQTVGSMSPPANQNLRRTAKRMDETPVTYGKHYVPWTAGINARYDISKHWAIETGLTYTELKSELLTWKDQELITQRLHYVGIPLKVDYKILRWNKFACYASAGGMVEKCVYATIDEDSFNVPELQYSSNVSAGVEYNIDKHLSVYIEPGVSYFFDNEDNVKSIRKASPLTVNITGGLRVNINP